MSPENDVYRIRFASPDEVARLQEIENEAGTIFSGLRLIDETLDVSFPVEELKRLVLREQVWVADVGVGQPVGMVIVSEREGSAYIEEMDVLPAYGRRGIGARLLARACVWAEGQGHHAIWLSTFRDVPWNGPFYRKHGFMDLAPADWTSGMLEIREKEAKHGLRMDARVFMRREIGNAR